MSQFFDKISRLDLGQLGPYLQLKTLVLIPIAWIVLVVASWFIQRYFLIGAYRNYRKLPPGPPSSILTGTPDYQRGKTHIYFKKLSKIYGDIFSVWDGPNLQIVLNSPQIIQELNGKRGANYNSRPKMYVFHDCIFRGISISSTAYGERWRTQRKIFNSISGPTASKALLPYQDFESKQYLHDLLQKPADFYNHAERFGTSILTTTVYGLRADDFNNSAASGLILMGAWLEANLSPGKYVDDRWPILQKIPRVLAPWRSLYDENASLLDRIARAWWDPAITNIRRGNAVPCFVTRFVDTYQSEGFTENEAALISLGLMLAGAGTSAATQNFLIMGCALFPEAVRLAHEELDRVVGRSRLPTLEDEPNLPYLRAMVKETLRWRPFSNQGFYHATVKDDIYNGFFIPAGTTIINNAYSVHQNESRWRDPENFDPSRYLGYKLGAVEYANLKDSDQRDHFAYGAGRRICAGMSVAEPSLFILAARMLWGFNVSQAKDEKGNLVPIDTLAYADGVFGKPHNVIKASITCRSPEHAEVIEREFADAKSPVRTLGEASRSGDMPGMAALVEELKHHPDCQILGL